MEYIMQYTYCHEDDFPTTYLNEPSYTLMDVIHKRLLIKHEHDIIKRNKIFEAYPKYHWLGNHCLSEE